MDQDDLNMSPRKPRRPPRERDIEEYLCARARSAKGELRKVGWIGRKSAPDRLVLLPGRQIWAELKAPGKTATAAQAREHQRMRKLGCTVLVINSFAQVDALFEG